MFPFLSPEGRSTREEFVPTIHSKVTRAPAHGDLSSALIGCGTYAESNLGGVSCTGDGEAIIRVVLARRALETLKSVDDPGQACRVAVDVLVEEGRGQGGLILVDWRGRTGWAHSTPLLPVGFMSPSHAAPIVPF